jgi:enamine deaminase RidA (YjgF/YER057c/UK114 family)
MGGVFNEAAMTIRRITTGSTWEAKVGYARAVVAGGWVHVSGTTGTDHATGAIPEAVTDQCALALQIIDAALTAGADWGRFSAGAIVGSVPVVVLFFVLPKQLVEGLAAGSVKG